MRGEVTITNFTTWHRTEWAGVPGLPGGTLLDDTALLPGETVVASPDGEELLTLAAKAFADDPQGPSVVLTPGDTGFDAYVGDGVNTVSSSTTTTSYFGADSIISETAGHNQPPQNLLGLRISPSNSSVRITYVYTYIPAP